MIRAIRMSVLIVAVALAASSTLIAETAEQTLVRMFSYDPHPNSARFAEKAPFNGQMHDFEIVFIESWQTKGETGNLKQIAFKIQAMQGEQIIASSDTIPVAAAKIAKDQQIGNVKIGDVNFAASVIEIAKNKSGITDLTVSFKLSYDKSSLDTAQNQPDRRAAVSELDFARKLAERAAAIPADKPAAKISMYKRAIMSAPAATTSAEAAAFHKEISLAIADLQNASASFKPFKRTEPVFETVPIEKLPVASEAALTASPEATATPAKSLEKSAPEPRADVPETAVTLYKEARNLLAQDKGPEGREALRKALEIAPAYHDALMLLGDNATENRRWAKAKDAFKQALDIKDRDADTLLKYFKACYYIGEGADAILYLDQVRNKYPTERRIQLAVAEANFQLGDLPAAKALCEDMLVKDPEDSRVKDLLERVNRLYK